MTYDPFVTIDDAECYSRNPYFYPGPFDVQVELVKVFDGREKTFFLVEAKILASTCPACKAYRVGSGHLCPPELVAQLAAQRISIEDKLPPGQTGSWLQDLKKDAAMGNIKGFVLACVPDAAKHGLKDLMKTIYGPSNPLSGVKIHLDVTPIVTRAGKDFSRHDWSEYQGPDSGRLTVAEIRGGARPQVPPPFVPPAPPGPPAILSPDKAWRLEKGAWVPNA